MVIKTRVFELRRGKYKNLSELASAMGMSVSQIYRVHKGESHINQTFILGAIQAFPGRTLNELFYFAE